MFESKRNCVLCNQQVFVRDVRKEAWCLQCLPKKGAASRYRGGGSNFGTAEKVRILNDKTTRVGSFNEKGSK